MSSLFCMTDLLFRWKTWPWGSGVRWNKGRSSSTSFKKSSLLILKFFFQSSSKHLPYIILHHQRSVRPGFIQKRFFFQDLLLNDLKRRHVKADFCRTCRRARLFLRAVSLLNTRFVNEFVKFIAEISATTAVMGNMPVTTDAMFRIYTYMCI